MPKLTSTYYLCNKDNAKIVEFEVLFAPTNFAITEATILEESLLPEEFKDKDICLVLYHFMRNYACDLVDGIQNGPEKDAYIAQRLKVKSWTKNTHIRAFNGDGVSNCDYTISL